MACGSDVWENIYRDGLRVGEKCKNERENETE